MNLLYSAGVLGLLCLMALAGFAERVYGELERFLSRESGESRRDLGRCPWSRACD